MINLVKTSLTRTRSRFSQLFPPLSQVASSQPVNPHVSEEPDYYTTGGFHPISLGDTFKSDQYTVLRKLGYGQYSTVWLAKDSKHQKYVTLKMLRADCFGISYNIFEKEILSRIGDVSSRSSHEGRNYVSPLLEQFKHAGPSGDHVCLVFDVLGHHMIYQSIKYEDGKIPVKAMKVIIRQLLLGLDFLHTECGVIHTDLKPTNLLLELQNSNNTISHYLSTVPVRTNPEQSTRPLREVIPTPLVSETDNIHIRIIDFGVSSWRGKRLSDRIQSPTLRAPEVTIGAPWDTGVDIWSLGCLVVEFIQGIVLFSGEASPKGTWTADDDRLARTIEILGRFPADFLERGARAGDFFDKQGNLRRIPNMQSTSLERLLNGPRKPFSKPTDMSDAEVPIFIDFVKGMLEIDPAARKSAAELLLHDWICS
ncbi:protein kinase [Aspergillus californicus]